MEGLGKWLFCTGMAETAGPAFGVVEGFHNLPLHGLVAGHNHLADALAVVDSLWLIAQVGTDYAHLAAIVGFRARPLRGRIWHS